MFESAILNILVFIIVFVILIEYINDKMYQTKKPTEPKKEIPEEEKIPQEEPEPQVEEKPEIEEAPEEVEEVQPETVEEVPPEVVVEVEPEEVIEEVQPEPEIEPEEAIEEVQPEPEAVVEEVEETKELPACKYPPFTHVRLVDMGLSDDEATEFVNELIPQLEEHVPLIENAINSADFHQIEKLTHGIKGSATNLGTGGVSDLLVEFNTYLKSGTDTDIVKAYHEHFVHYIEELKKQYT